MPSGDVRIGEVTTTVAKLNPAEGCPDSEFCYIDIGSVDRVSKAIVDTQAIPGRDAPSRARQPVMEGDVLVSTVRPNLNAVALVQRKYHGAVASTGFSVLRPNTELLHSGYLFHWVRSPQFVHSVSRQATGASYPAVSDRLVRSMSIPLPPIEEQRRIADILDKADAIRRKRQEAIALTDDLLRSTFLEMVSVGHSDYVGWDKTQIQHLAQRGKGGMRTGPFGSALRHSEFVDRGIAVLGIDNAVRNEFAWDERRYITAEKYEGLRRYTVKPHDVIITIMGTTGRTAVVPDDIPTAITTKHLATITVDRDLAEPEFIAHAIRLDQWVLGQLAGRSRGAIMAGLNLGIIRELELRVPPLWLQREFGRMVDKVRHLRSHLSSAAEQSDALFGSLQQRAFRGEL